MIDRRSFIQEAAKVADGDTIIFGSTFETYFAKNVLIDSLPGLVRNSDRRQRNQSFYQQSLCNISLSGNLV